VALSASGNIGLVTDSFQVSRVNTIAVAAKVIEFEAFWDWALKSEIAVTVSPALAESTVAFVMGAAPKPATISLQFDLRPESFKAVRLLVSGGEESTSH
jgi:hypothetical protein